jgi:transglutaminase-like putative cysteine protease
MRKIATLVMLITIPALSSFAQQIYRAADIPSDLRVGANAVIREKETTVNMLSADNVVYTVKEALTVLNKGGEDHAMLILSYNKNTAIKSAKGQVLDAQGSVVSKFTLNNFIDQSAVSDFSLYEDDRLKYYRPVITSYPITIVYEYEIRSKQNLIIPDWYANPQLDLAVEKSTYTFNYNPAEKIRIKAYNYKGEAKELQTVKQNSLIWSVENLAAFKQEPYAPSPDNFRTYVKIAPEQFAYYRTKGKYSNWDDLGKWIYTDLIKTRQALNPSVVAEMKSLVQGLSSDKEKAKRIYEYMQRKTRYISVQIGIGGFQPMFSNDVDRLGYGDCKALVSYMQSLLAAVDIPSYYSVVYAGQTKQNMDPEFASMDQGNHVILALPLGKDTTWLECTNQNIPFGFLGDFTDDRLVLACTENGGKLLRTPVLKTEVNQTTRKATLVVDQTGNITGTTNTTYKGSQYDMHEALIRKPLSEQKKMLSSYYDVDNMNFNQVSITQEKSEAPVTTEKLDIRIATYVPRSQQSAYLMPNAFNRQMVTKSVSNRKLPLYINRGYTDEDEISYQLPKGFEIDYQPQDLELKTPFGTYVSKISKKGDELVYYRKFILNNGTHPAKDYEAFAVFMNQVATADRAKVILKVN